MTLFLARRHRGRSSSDSHDSGAVYRGPARKSAPRAADWLVGGAPPMEGHTASPQVRFVLAREHEQRLAAHRQVHASTGANQPVDLDPPGSPLPREQPPAGRRRAEPRARRRHETGLLAKPSVQPPVAMPAMQRAGPEPEEAAPARAVEEQRAEPPAVARVGRAAGRRSRSGLPNGGCPCGRTRRRVPGCRSGRPWQARSLRRASRPDARSQHRDASASPSSPPASGSSASDR